MAETGKIPQGLTARQLLRHIKPLKLPERLAAEFPVTTIIVDRDMHDALMERADGLPDDLADNLAESLVVFETMTGDDLLDAVRIVVGVMDESNSPVGDFRELLDMPVLSLTGDYLMAIAAGLDPWSDISLLDGETLPGDVYGVVCLPRSGSTYFCHLLQGLGTLGRPTEHLRPHILFLIEHGAALGFDPLRWLLLSARTAEIGRPFGSKIITDFAIALWPLLDEEQRALMMDHFAGAKLIHLERTDKFAQAVSQFIADETRIWHVRKKDDESAYRTAKQAIVYDGERLGAIYRTFVDDERKLARWLQAWPGPVHHLTYEELVENPEQAVSQTAAFILDESPEPVDLTHEKYLPMSDDINRSFADRLRSDLAETPATVSDRPARPPASPPNRHDDPLFTLVMEINEDRYRIHDRGDYRIWLNVSESRQMVKRAIGRYEPEKFAALKEVLKPGSTFLDIGGNKGDFALFAAGLVGPQGRVVCFEPHPENAGWIRKSVELNGFAYLAVEELALADRDGEATLNIGGKSGQHSFEARKRDRGSVPVRTMTLDHFAAEAGLDRIHAIKIDVEGAEDLVIAGAAELLARDRPVLFLDVHDIGDERLAALTKVLLALDYRITELESGAAASGLQADRDYVLRQE